MALTLYPWKNKGEIGSPTKLTRQNLNAAEEALGEQLVQTTGAQNISGEKVFATKIAIKASEFTDPYISALYIGPTTQENPTTNTQGIYVQHRVKGNLNGQVQDAIIAELRLNECSNGAQGDNGLEASLVVTGGLMELEHLNGVVANFHTEGTPTGEIKEVALIRATEVSEKAAGLTVGKLYSLHLDKQTKGTTNYTIHAPEGNSVLGKIVPQAKTEKALVCRGLEGQEAQVFTIENYLNTTMCALLANGTGGIGALISGVAWWINNNNAATSTVNLVLRAIASQTGDLIQAQDSEGHVHCRLTKANSTTAASLVLGREALALTATDGFLYVPTTAGKPTGTPTAQTGTVPLCFDTTNKKLSAYTGGAWVQTAAFS